MTKPTNEVDARQAAMHGRGECDEARIANCDEAPLKGPLRVREARQRIAELEQIIRDGKKTGQQMCAGFVEKFPEAPAKLVRYHDRSLTFYRWRQSGSRNWGGSTKTAINLTGDAGLALLARVPESAQRHWLNYERRRIYINMRMSIATYELYRLQDWLDGLDAIKEIERDGLDGAHARRNQNRTQT